MFLVNLNSALLIFFAAAFCVFCPPSRRWLYLLLLSSLLLLIASPQAFALCLAQTILAYNMGLWLGGARARVWPFWLCVGFQLAPLLCYKSVGASNWAVPLGLSYYTFQILAYLIEIQWGRIEPARRFGPFAAYILFFANKVAGPIERPGLLKQMISVETPTGEELFRSAMWIWLGLFQKFVIGDHLAEYVLPVLRFPDNYSGLTATVAVLLSKYQIFCDFSGISLIALGIGGLFGLKLTPNFARPFASRSLREFWSRWHISLQGWIRDYVFFPLLGTPLARLGVLPIMMVTFVLFGLWHDWRWTFVAYGVAQALLVRFEPSAFLRRFGWPVAVAFNYVVLISLPGVLFRAQTFADALAVWRNMGLDPKNWGFFWDLGATKLPTLAFLIVLHETVQWAQFRHDLFARLARLPWAIKMLIAFLLMVFLIVFAKFDPQSTFIYSHF